MTPELLRTVSAFASVDERHLQRLAGYAREMAVSAGVDLAEQGGHGGEFMVIVEGDADVLRGGRLVGRLTAGDCFGVLGARELTPRTATVTARTPMRLITFAGWDVHRLGPDLLREIDGQLHRHLTVHID